MIDDYVDIIKGLHTLGVTYTDIAKALRINPGTLNAYISQHRDIFGYDRDYHVVSESESEDIFNEYMINGDTQTAIAKCHGICMKTVNHHILINMKKQGSLAQ